jgi:hypothetical protein
MKGTVLFFNAQERSGFISAENESRYSFMLDEWKSDIEPQQGMGVDFLPENSKATQIFLISNTSHPLRKNAQTEPPSIAKTNKSNDGFSTAKPRIDASNEDANMAVLMWIGTIFLGFIPPLIGYFAFTGKPLIRAHSLAGLNFSITICLLYFVAYLLSFFVIGFFLFPFLFIWTLYVCVKGAISAQKKEPYSPAMTPELLK